MHLQLFSEWQALQREDNHYSGERRLGEAARWMRQKEPRDTCKRMWRSLNKAESCRRGLVWRSPEKNGIVGHSLTEGMEKQSWEEEKGTPRRGGGDPNEHNAQLTACKSCLTCELTPKLSWKCMKDLEFGWLGKQGYSRTMWSGAKHKQDQIPQPNNSLS